jgi:ribosomal protein S11
MSIQMKKKKFFKKQRVSQKFKSRSPFKSAFFHNFNSFFRIQRNSTTFQMSAGKANLRSSKRLAKDSAHKIVTNFIKKCRLLCHSKDILLTYSGPSRLRRPLLRRLLRTFRYWRVRLLSVFLFANIIFNGCRPPKRRRKKKLRFRLSRS